MADEAFRVEWSAGKIIVHTSSREAAIAVALEYIRVADAKRISAQPLTEWEAETAKDGGTNAV